jgi:hypothetical protein
VLTDKNYALTGQEVAQLRIMFGDHSIHRTASCWQMKASLIYKLIKQRTKCGKNTWTHTKCWHASALLRDPPTYPRLLPSWTPSIVCDPETFESPGLSSWEGYAPTQAGESWQTRRHNCGPQYIVLPELDFPLMQLWQDAVLE